MRKQLTTACKGSLAFCFLFLSKVIVLAQSNQPQDVQACLGGVVSLEVTDPPQHSDVRQWQVSSNGVNYSNITGATSLSYTFTATAADHNRYYRLVLSNGGNQQASNRIFRIQVQNPPAAPTVTHGARTGIGSVTLGASAPSGYTYKWYAVKAGGVPINGATSASYITPELSTTTTYYVAAVSPAGCEGPRTAVTATISGVSHTIVTNSRLISNNQMAQPLDPLIAIAPETTADVELYRITSVPDRVQGKLFVAGTEVLSGQELTPAQITQLTFTPEPTFYGTATFAYRTINKDGMLSSSAVIYHIPVNAVPLARNVSSNMISSGKSYNLLPYPLNAIDFDGDIVRYTITSVPISGSLSVSPTGSPALQAGNVITTNKLYYNPDQNGKSEILRTFTYTATDNKGVTSDVATYFLYIEIVPVNNAPVTESRVLPAVSNAAATQVALPPLTASDIDGYVTGYIVGSVTPPDAGTLYLNGSPVAGTNRHNTESGMLGSFAFEPTPGFSGSAQFTFNAIDNADATSAPATYTIPVTSPPQTKDVTFTVEADNPNAQRIAALDATDPDGSITSYTILSLPHRNAGTLTLNGQPVMAGQVLTPAEAATLDFLKAATYSSPASFTFTASDDYGIKAQRSANYTLVPDRITPLPVTLVRFSATSQPEGARLTWTTATELQNDYFAIEKSTDGKVFKEIARVKGAGTSSIKLQYTFVDETFTQGTAYYRLKQTDFDGTATYSKTIALRNQHFVSGFTVQAFPNPVENNLTVRLAVPGHTVAVLKLYSLQGELLTIINAKPEQGITHYELPFTKLPSGVYLLRVLSGEESFTIKLLKK
ncbi:T9SS type A sorting domain-containing protein [Pontibacter sp. Tf4]|uniref:Ig-like domain-containing protein n=1 Tax=Pontibacter sp. Tf4 TaxID=2761620 RepID=UPI0016246CC4|nr:T9SS type A sorting domain-containing protein [Pontibacter sp. Tf4]MBB6612097.1 T9SS type A sorting domain-containing protein [Pontibacter sp. Tf4]